MIGEKDWRVVGKCSRCRRNIYHWQEHQATGLDGKFIHSSHLKEKKVEGYPDFCPQCGAKTEERDESLECSSPLCNWWKAY